MPFRKIKLNNPRTDKLIQWTYFVVAPILLGVVITALFFSITTNSSLKGVAERVQQLSEDNKNLSQQNKDLGEQNKELNQQTQAVVQQNRDYIRCLADTFAQYTRDQRPVEKFILDDCNVKTGMSLSFDAKQDASGQAPSGNAVSSTSSSSNTTPSNEQAQPDTSQDTNNNNTPTPEVQPLKVLGIPVCVPLTDKCVMQ